MSGVVRGGDCQLGYFVGHELLAGPDCFGGDDEAGNDTSFPATVERAMALGEKRDAEDTRPDCIHPRYAADKDIVNRLRFHKRRFRNTYHDDSVPSALLFSEGQRTASHCTISDAMGASRRRYFRTQNVSGHDLFSFNSCATTGAA